MKNLLIIITICFSFGALAQSWAPVGAEWYYMKYHPYEPGNSYAKIEVEKDTLYHGQLCSKLIGDFQTSWGTDPKYTYESNDTVYFYHEKLEEFLMLFDIGASPGDTWQINYDSSAPPPEDTIEIIVDSVGQKVIDGETLRVVYITQTNVQEIGYGYYGPIIERVGAPLMLTNYFNYDPSGPVRCYSDGVIDYHPDPSTPCDYSNVGLKEEEQSKLNVYPNPVSSLLNIVTDLDSDLNFVIYDYVGKKVLEGKTLNGQIDVSSLNEGSYILKIGEGDEGYNMRKFVKD